MYVVVCCCVCVYCVCVCMHMYPDSLNNYFLPCYKRNYMCCYRYAVVNVTMPDDKQNYIHRIGRVGRADRMGLAISLVATAKEKVWYHSCPSKGKSCCNTNLKEHGGCAIWYDEKQVSLVMLDFL